VTFGVPFPFSMHVELLRYWAQGTGLGAEGLRISTVPPPLMSSALAAGDIDAFCVGEPWGSVAVDQGAGALLLPGHAIWNFAPEKVLAVRSDWAETEPELLGRLMRSVWRAGKWLSVPDNRAFAGEILSRRAFLDLAPEMIDRSLSGRLTVTRQGEERHVPGFMEFFDGAATFPWRSQAKWIASRLSQSHATGMPSALDDVAAVFRSDLNRRHLASTGADFPGASAKLEGSIRQDTPVASARGWLSLRPDAFFDGQIFEPDRAD